MEQHSEKLIANTALAVSKVVELGPIELAWVAGRAGADTLLQPVSGSYPGTVMVGYLNSIHPHPIQVIGPAEMSYLGRFGPDELMGLLQRLMGAPQTGAVIVANQLDVTTELITAAEQHRVALLSSREPAPDLIASLQNFLSEQMTPRTLLHGVMMAVYGLGVLITGSSGIGKSELGLELLSRNHRLVADDAVEIHRAPNDDLIASCPESLRGHLEVRGLGILNIREMFGYASVLDNRRLDLIVQLQRLRAGSESKLDRLQIQRARQIVLGLERPRVSLLIAPGRNLAVLVEAAVRDCILRMRGRNAAAEFVDRQQKSIETPDTG